MVRDTEDDLLFNHSRRVFFWGALTGDRRGLKYDPELLYLGAMFHDMGLTEKNSSPDLRFEVDGANIARDFMKSYGVNERDIEDVWISIALHTTPGVPEHMRPTIALVAAGVEMDVLGIAYHDFTHEQRDHVCAHHSILPPCSQGRPAIANPLCFGAGIGGRSAPGVIALTSANSVL